MSLSTINSKADSVGNRTRIWRRYGSWYASALLVLCGLAACFNAVVDPHGRLLWFDEPDINQIKITLPTNSRRGKAAALRQCDYDTIVVGTSRTESGIDVEQPAFAGTRVYNAALVSASMYEIRRIVEYALDYQSLDRVVIGLDFVAFNNAAAYFDDFAESPLVEQPSPASLARYLVSVRTLRESWATLKLNAAGRLVMCADNGEHKPRGGVRRKTAVRTAFDFILKRYASGQYYDYVAGEQHFTSLEIILRKLAAADVQVFGFISPMHVTHLEMLREMGRLEDYHAWKQRVTQIFAAARAGVSGPRQPELWDFARYNAVTTEVVPDTPEQTTMRWYTDSSHYRPSVGNAIINQMLAVTAESDLPPGNNLGVLLTPANLAEVTAAEVSGSAQYQRDNPAELDRLREMLQSVPDEAYRGFVE